MFFIFTMQFLLSFKFINVGFYSFCFVIFVLFHLLPYKRVLKLDSDLKKKLMLKNSLKF